MMYSCPQSVGGWDLGLVALAPRWVPGGLGARDGRSPLPF